MPRQIEWSTEAAERLKAAMDGDDDEIEAEVRAGGAQLLDWGGELLTVVRREGSEFVYMCVAGRNLKRWADQFAAYARAQGCETVRIHPIRPGIVRMLRKMGLVRIADGVYRKNLNGR